MSPLQPGGEPTLSDTCIDTMPYPELDEAYTGTCLDQPIGAEPVMKPTHTPPRSIRVPDELWEAARRVSTERGESLSEATNRFYARYVKDHARKQSQEAGVPLEEILRRLGA